MGRVTNKGAVLLQALGSDEAVVALNRMLGSEDASYELVNGCLEELNLRADQLDAEGRVDLGTLLVSRGGMLSVIGRTLRIRAGRALADESKTAPKP